MLPFDPPLEPMLARAASGLPSQPGWIYEPKWDGFRVLVFFDGTTAYLQSRDLKPLGRYFPELQAGLELVLPGPAILDGEIVIIGEYGLDFDALLMRIHPAASRVAMLARETPSSFVAFDILARGEVDLRDQRFSDRRSLLESYAPNPSPPFYVSPTTTDEQTAASWFEHFEGAGFDGVVAKPDHLPYRSGERALAKVKHSRTADCVVGGFRWYKDHEGSAVGSLLLGLYDREGVLHHVGHTASFTMEQRKDLVGLLQPYVDDSADSFGQGRTPGGPNRWTQGRDTSWVPVRPELVCEVRYDQLQGNRFRSAAGFRRWRPDKPPRDCRYAQLAVRPPAELMAIFDRAR